MKIFKYTDQNGINHNFAITSHAILGNCIRIHTNTDVLVIVLYKNDKDKLQVPWDGVNSKSIDDVIGYKEYIDRIVGLFVFS